ncbi:MAG: hypothetical protein ACUVSQ_04055 [Pseudanabaenaceae cyanobacterium]
MASFSEPREPGGFSLARVLVALGLPVLALMAYLSFQFLRDPWTHYWPFLAEAPPLPTGGLETPLTIAEINEDLAAVQLKLGKPLFFEAQPSRTLATKAVQVYPVLGTTSQEIREIRVYEQATEKSEKLRLLARLPVDGLEDTFVRSPGLKYNPAGQRKLPLGSRLPLKELAVIPGPNPAAGLWFLAYGRTGQNPYGKVLVYTAGDRPILENLLDWTSPAGQLPKWENLLAAAYTWASPNLKSPFAADEQQLVVYQNQIYEPDLRVYRVAQPQNPTRPFELRQVTLNEAVDMPAAYRRAIELAGGGLWSLALQEFQRARQELGGRNLALSVEEQYSLIAAHARITSERAKQPQTDSGIRVLLLLIDGQWQTALKHLRDTPAIAAKVAAALERYPYLVEPRIDVAVKVNNTEEAVVWGALLTMYREGYRAAREGLAKRQQETAQRLAILQELDVLPLAARVTALFGEVSPWNGDLEVWDLPPGSLPPGETWYEVEVMALQTAEDWQLEPLAELGRRSPKAVWRGLGLDNNGALAATTVDADGFARGALLQARSLQVDGTGRVRVLATGSRDLLDSGTPLAAYSNTLAFNTASERVGAFSLPEPIRRQMADALYQELQALGDVSLSREAFADQFQRWNLSQTDANGDGRPDWLLEIDRLKIDVGDRPYPAIAVFDGTGTLLYSDLRPDNRTNRRWVTLLAGNRALVREGDRYRIRPILP